MKASMTCVIRLMVGLPLVPACVYSLSLPAFIACPGSKVSQDWEYLLEPARVYSLSRSENVSMTCVIRLPTLKHVGFSLLHKRQCIVSLRLDYLYQTLLLSDIFSYHACLLDEGI